ncbi:MAG: exodeoxyribonuclease VII large subunit [Leptospiraceae bacterium]|nr:exodeoxyribonuclease VII large subunit [Leptospiraceae bacterium]MCP5499639.1 exodeoxyribonuclease VII large subunit [Leptospiraceae bacterium]
MDKKIYTVSEINRNVKDTLNANPEFKNIWVRGEISNYSSSGTGHKYFSLKDSSSIIRCTFFSYAFRSYKGRPLKDGMEVQVYGNLSVYEAGGSYNINVNQLEEIGRGEILLKIEKLKKELEQKGIFNPERKRPVPRLPRTLGIATSGYGAALEDILRIAKERYPNINILIAPCQVQGPQAPDSIIRAIEALNQPEFEVDVIIAGRGGGSFEDLMAFNEEKVVMAFYHSRVPIISAVGHQVDSLLSDFAADNYAPTPTAAAKLAVPEMEEYEDYFSEIEEKLSRSLNTRLQYGKEKLQSLSRRRFFEEPKTLLHEKMQKLDEMMERLGYIGKNYLSLKKNALQNYDRLPLYMKAKLEKAGKSFAVIEGRLESFSPLSTLKRGYSVLRNHNKQVIKDIREVKSGESLEIILSKGRLEVEVKEIRND